LNRFESGAAPEEKFVILFTFVRLCVPFLFTKIQSSPMTMQKPDPRLMQSAIDQFRTLHGQDPAKVTVDGIEKSRSLHEAERILHWINQLWPNPPASLELAAYTQHICRWEVPRSTYPDGRNGYLKWRSDLRVFHANKACEILNCLAAPDELIASVEKINLKKGMTQDPEVQTMEDALCLTFLESQLDHYREHWERDKARGILAKTWQKMSEKGRSAALAMPHSPENLILLKEALS
jgi:hypothetical protein